MDLLDFDSEAMYFDEPLPPPVLALIDEAAQRYRTQRGGAVDSGLDGPDDADDGAELCLLQAYFLAPERLAVLVALYRFFYYRHRYEDALLVADRAIAAACRQLGLSEDWRQLDAEVLKRAAGQSMTMTRFLLLALKGAAWLLLRQEQPEPALERLAPLIAFDSKDQLGHKDLQRWAEKALLRQQVAATGGKVRLLRE
jgi:hypothetical protein